MYASHFMFKTIWQNFSTLKDDGTTIKRETDQCNRVEPRIKPRIYSHFILTKSPKTHMGKDNFTINITVKPEYPHSEE